MAEQPQRKPIPLTQLDVMSNWMYADPVAGGTRRPNLRVRVMGNVPRFVVRTNVPDDKNNGRIDFHTDLATFSVIIAKLEELAKGDTTSYEWTYEDHIFNNGKRSETPVTISTLRIGKDREDGRVYIAVLGYNRPKIQFFFGPSRFHKFRYGDGSEITMADQSAAYAMGFVKGYAPIVHQLLVSTFDEEARNVPKPPPQQDQQGGGNYQQRSGNYQQQNKPQRSVNRDFENADSFDDMVAF